MTLQEAQTKLNLAAVEWCISKMGEWLTIEESALFEIVQDFTVVAAEEEQLDEDIKKLIIEYIEQTKETIESELDNGKE